MGATVTVASDPFEATARFAEAPADLVVVSLEGWGRKDLRFLSAVRAAGRRGPGRRAGARRPPATWPGRRSPRVRTPTSASPSTSASSRRSPAASSRRRRGRPRVDDPAGLPHLAAEVGHAVNNPLQVLSLLLEDSGGRPPTAEGGERDRDLRVRGRPHPRGDGGPHRLRAALGPRSRTASTSPPPSPRPPPASRRAASSSVVHARSHGGTGDSRRHARPRPRRPRPGRPGPRRARPRPRRPVLRAVRPGCAARPAGTAAPARSALRVRGVHLDAATFAAAARSVLGVDERTRGPPPRSRPRRRRRPRPRGIASRTARPLGVRSSSGRSAAPLAAPSGGAAAGMREAPPWKFGSPPTDLP